MKDSGAYNYFLKLDSTKEDFYAFRFRVDQNNNIIAVVINLFQWSIGQKIEVQFIYTGEVSPGGAWYTDPNSLDVLDATFNYEKSLLDITHEQKIQILGEPTMTAEEVIAALQ